MDAARLNAAAKGHDTALLDKLLTHQRQQHLAAAMAADPVASSPVGAGAPDTAAGIDEAEIGGTEGEADDIAAQRPPNGRYNYRRLDDRLAATR
jgi:hypothetical protein